MKSEEEIKEMKEFINGCLIRHHMKMFDIHSRAIACHCECLGMNAENSIAVCKGNTPPFDDHNYDAVMQKWELINEKGELII